MKPKTLRGYFEGAFTAAVLAHQTVKTRRQYSVAFDRFVGYLGCDPKLSEVKESSVKAFCDWFVETGRGDEATAKVYRRMLRRVLRQATGGKICRAAGRGDRLPAETSIGAFVPTKPRPVKPSRLTKDAPAPDGSLLHFLRTIYLVEKNLATGSARQLEWSVVAFDDWHGSPVMLSELSDKLVGAWVQSQEGAYAPKTIHRNRGAVLAIWNYAFEVEALDVQPRRVRKVRVPRTIPDAWNQAELSAILRAAEQLAGCYPHGVKRCDYWTAFILTSYETGLRLGDVLGLRESNLSDDGAVVVIQKKTGLPHVATIRPSTRAAIDRTKPGTRDLVFEWPHVRRMFYLHWQEILAAAGIPANRRNGPQKLRRSSASHLEAVSPGAAMRHLGHATPGLASRHYIDPRVARVQRELPPELSRGADA